MRLGRGAAKKGIFAKMFKSRPTLYVFFGPVQNMRVYGDGFDSLGRSRVLNYLPTLSG